MDQQQPPQESGEIERLRARVRELESRLAEQELERLLLRHARDIQVILNRDQSQRYVSPGALDITGFQLEELRGKTIENLIHPDDLPAVVAAWGEATAHPGRVVTVRYRHLHKTDGWVFTEAVAQSFLDDPSINGVIASVRDVNDQMRAEQALRASEDRLREQADFTRRVLDSTAAHIAILDPQGIIIDVNTPWVRFAADNDGTTTPPLGAGDNYFSAWSATFGDAAKAEEAFAGIRRVQRGEIDSFAITLPWHDASTTRWFSLRVLPLAGKQGYVLLSHTDVSALKLTEERLCRALAEKELLLRELHHRVKNNLAAIIGLLDMQRRSLTDPQARESLTVLAGRIRSMGLIHEILYGADNLARIDFQNYSEVLITHLRSRFGSSRIKVTVRSGGVRLPLDLAMPCGLIINELATNALKFAFPRGMPVGDEDECRVEVRLQEENGQYTLTVADNGQGLPPGFDWTRTQSMGMVLLRMLGCHQLGGNYTFDHDKGLRVTLRFHEQRGA